MKKQFRIFRLLLGVALIAELCFFLPDVKAQEITFVDGSHAFKKWFVSEYDKYEKEYCDTIRATYSQTLENYLVTRKNYTEAYSKEQLEQKGYKYKYRWVKGNDAALLEFEYIFVKEPTLKEFMGYWRMQGKK
ncbi:MAG: hypothetical protein ABIG69_06695 [Bacteroidota bacterium]